MTTSAAIQTPFVSSSATAIRQHGANNAVYIRSKMFAFPVKLASSPTSYNRRFAVAASRSTKEEATSKSEDSFTSQAQDDVSFLLKLGVGSSVGAAAIKYGSILVPEITRPNMIQALIMISTPVIVSVLVLIKESRYNSS